MRWSSESGLELLSFEICGPRARAVVTTRAGGVSTAPYDTLNLGYHVGDAAADVAENRRRVCAALGIDALTVADQQHRARVAAIGTSLAGAGHVSHEDAVERLPGTDGMVTNEPGVALTVLVADCQPIVLWDPVARALGVAHAGRGGTILGVVPEVVRAMCEGFGSRPADLRAGIGPHISVSSYEVGPQEVSQTVEAFPELPEVVRPTQEGRGCLDLALAVRAQLEACGIPRDSIEHSGINTRESTDRFFSDRAQRPCGRFALVAVIDS